MARQIQRKSAKRGACPLSNIGGNIMFNNAKDYGKFLKHECNNCPFYVRWDDESSDKPICKIEEQIAFAVYTGNAIEFPYEWMEEHGDEVYSCKKKPKTLEVEAC
jgi:hypothetical protein